MVMQAVELIKFLSHPLEPVPTGIKPLIPDGISSIRAVIFDIYGTLFISAAGDIGKDSAADNAQFFLQALEDASIPVPEEGQLLSGPDIFRDEILACHKRLKAEGVEFPEVDICKIWKNVLARLEIDRGVTQEQIELLAISYECRTNPVWPMPGLLSLLNTLRDQKIAIGIISNAQFYTLLMFEALLGRSMYELGFDPDICQFSWQQKVAKPSPLMFHKVRDVLEHKYNIGPHATLYMGNDMLKDILPAHEVRWKTALFAGDRRSLRLREDDSRVSGITPWCVVTALEQLESGFIG